jgi:hypothetical protein
MFKFPLLLTSLLFVLTIPASAQESYALKPKEDGRFQEQKTVPSPTLFFQNDLHPFALLPHEYSPSIDPAVHHTAFFCKMEDKLHEHFNIWIKLRAGDDDYRNIIK